jgi:hypothetical protein
MDQNQILAAVAADPTILEKYIKENLGTVLAEDPKLIENYIKENPAIALAAAQDLLSSTDVQPILDSVTMGPPFNFPDTVVFSVSGTDATVFHIAGLVAPIAVIVLLMLFMRNCYGYVFAFLWIVLLAIWGGLVGILFPMDLSYKNQIQLLSKYVLIFIAALFGVLTTIGFILRIFSIPLQVLAAPLASAPAAPPVAAPPVHVPAPQPPPVAVPPQLKPPQAGGGTKRNPLKGHPNLLYIPKAT